jgi:hypothetical protein
LADPKDAVAVLYRALNEHLPSRLGYDPPPEHQHDRKPVQHIDWDPEDQSTKDRDTPGPLDAIIAAEDDEARRALAKRRLDDLLELLTPADGEKLLDAMGLFDRRDVDDRAARRLVAEERGITRQAVDNVYTRARKRERPGREEDAE